VCSKNQNCHSVAGEESPFFLSSQKIKRGDPSALQPQDDKERQAYKNFYNTLSNPKSNLLL
jgi:hypothetical protein